MPTLKQTTSHEKASWNWHHLTKNVQSVGSFSSQKIRYIYIYTYSFHLQPPFLTPPFRVTPELPGSKASRWRRGGGSPSWDKICNGPVKGLKTEWQALPRGFRALQDSRNLFVDSGRWNGCGFWVGENTISFGKSMECHPENCFFSACFISKKMIKIPPRWSQIIGSWKASFISKVSFTYAPRCCGVSLLLSCAEAMKHRPISLFFRGA